MKSVLHSTKTKIICCLFICITLADITNNDSINESKHEIQTINNTKTFVFDGECCTSISKKDIESIPVDTETFIVNSTQLVEIPTELFEKISNVETVVVTNNICLKKLPQSFFTLKHVKVLKLQTTCNFYELPTNFNSLEELTLMNIKLGELRPLLRSVREFKALRKLDISKNILNNVPGGVFDLHQIEVLNLSDNLLENIHQNITKMKNLKSLDVSSNLISSFESVGIDLFTKLENLDLSYNAFEKEKSTVFTIGYDSIFSKPVPVIQNEDNKVYNLKTFIISNNKKHYLHMYLKDLQMLL